MYINFQKIKTKTNIYKMFVVSIAQKLNPAVAFQYKRRNVQQNPPHHNNVNNF